MLRPRQKVPHNQLQYSVLAAILIVFTYSYLLPHAIIQSPYSEHKYQHAIPLPRDIASNSTLGFQKIFALSTGPSWRTRGLLASAAYTGVDIQIPKHTYSTNELAEAFQNIGPEDVIHPAFGSTMAWLAHLDMIKFVVANDFDTVLILEDDVDWDITLKNQMRLVSDSVRGFTASDAEDATPYGRLWDILWIGHCGEETDPATPRLEFPDSTAPSRANYTGWSKKYMTNLQDGHRVVQYGVNPVCTFAYAVSRTGAQKILEWAGKGQDEAYDIRLMWGCKKRELNCITVAPEIMHHYTPLTELGYVSLVDEKDDGGHSVDEASFEKVMGATENIVNSTRCKVLFNSPCVKKFREQ